MTDFEIASLAARILVGAGQIAVVWCGIRTMLRVTADREAQGKEQAEASRQQHVEVMAAADRRHAEAMQAADRQHTENMKESERRHAETMQAADRQHTENMKASDRQHAETMAVLDAQRRALEALIERTAPPRENRV